MGDIEQEVGDLLGESSPPEAEDEARGAEESSETAQGGEGGGENQNEGAEAEAEEAGSEGKQPEGEGSQEQEVEGSESESEGEEDPRDAQIRELQAEVNRLSKGEAAKTESEGEDEGSGEPKAAEPFDPFMGQDFDSILESKESFQQWAQGLYERAKKDAHEEVLKRLPETVSSYVQHQVSIQKAVDDFYSQNEDLADYKDYVGRIANEVQAENSNWTFEQILEETAKRARQKLGLKEQAQNSAKGKGGSGQKKPALSGGTKGSSTKARGGGSSGNELSEVEKEIQDILE